MRRGGLAGWSRRWYAAGTVLLVLLALLATSCRDVETKVDVHDDGTATVSFLVVPGMRNLDELGGEKGFARLISQFDDPGIGIKAKRVVEPAGVGMLVTVEARSLVALSKPYPLPTPPAPVGAALQLFDAFEVVHRNGTWRLDATARPVPQLGFGLPALSGQLDEATYEINIKLPGKVEASNGVEDQGGVSWTVKGNEPRKLLMRSADRGPVSPLILLIGGSAVLIVVGLMFASRGKDATTATKIYKESNRFLRRRTEEEKKGWQAVSSGSSLPSGAAASAASRAAPAVLYAEDYEGDDSLALPEPGAGWGPAPPEGTTTTGTVRPAPRATEKSDGPGATMGPSSPVVALDRGSRLGVAKDEPVDDAPAMPPGWYADPEDPSRQRFWDGVDWTEHRG